MYMKDSNGKKSASVTMAIVSFVIVMFKVLVGGASFSIGELSVSMGDIGAEEILAILTTTLGTYSFRRYTDKRYDRSDAEPEIGDMG